MASKTASTGHNLSKGASAAKLTEVHKGTGAVGMHHRLKMGVDGKELQSNPFGTGAPSHKSSIRNGGSKGW